MLENFTPFAEYDDNPVDGHATIKSMVDGYIQHWPKITLVGDEIECRDPRESAVDAPTRMLTEHIAFMLGQDAVTEQHSIPCCRLTVSRSGDFVYRMNSVSFPAGLAGTVFRPCYFHFDIPSEYDCGFLPEESVMAKKVILDPTDESLHQDHHLQLAYCLALPGSAVLAVTSMVLRVPKLRPPRYSKTHTPDPRIIVDPELALPRVDMVFCYRQHAFVQAVPQMLHRETSDKDNDLYRQKVRDDLRSAGKID